MTSLLARSILTLYIITYIYFLYSKIIRHWSKWDVRPFVHHWKFLTFYMKTAVNKHKHSIAYLLKSKFCDSLASIDISLSNISGRVGNTSRCCFRKSTKDLANCIWESSLIAASSDVPLLSAISRIHADNCWIIPKIFRRLLREIET